MSLNPVKLIRDFVWNGISEVLPLQNELDHSHQDKNADVFSRIYKICSNVIFFAKRPHRCTEKIFQLEDQLEKLGQLIQHSRSGDASSIRHCFHALSADLQNTLKWSIYANDSIVGRPIFGLDHGGIRFQQDPMIILDRKAHQVLHIHGSSLAIQLYCQLIDKLSIEYQKESCHLSQHNKLDVDKLKKMQLAFDMNTYDQMQVLSPLFKDDDIKISLESKMSAQALSWMNADDDRRRSKELFDICGAHFQDGVTHFCVYAPNASKVECVLTKFGKEDMAVAMSQKEDGTWVVSSSEAHPGKTYVYRIYTAQGHVFEKVDPFAFQCSFVPEKGMAESVVVDRHHFVWNDNVWIDARRKSKPLENPLSIYEVHVKSWDRFGRKHIRAFCFDLIHYCKEMGFSHVELYGLMEHFWLDGRGYQVSNFFSPYHDCACYDDVKYFVSEMHNHGIGVILDWIPAHYDHGTFDDKHFSSSLHYFDGTDLFSAGPSYWGTLYFDFSKKATCDLLHASALWWVHEFHIDGLRVDAVSQMIKRSGADHAAGEDFLRSLNSKIHSECPGVLMIAEASDWDPRICKPTDQGGLGFDINWGLGAARDLRDYLSTPPNERVHSIHHVDKLEKVFKEGTRFSEKKISTHSHDDTDSGYNHDRALYHIGRHHTHSDVERLKELRSFLAWQIFGPNWGHLIHMGDEMAQKESWYARFHHRLSGVQWNVVEVAAHRAFREFVKDCIHYYRSKDDFWKNGGCDAELFYSFAPNAILAYARGKQIVVHNFSSKEYHSYSIDLPQKFRDVKGLVERVNSDAVKYFGSGYFHNSNVSLVKDDQGRAKAMQIKLAARSAYVLEGSY
jgi:1,4-alpha-glucan branching enzyme